ncbi:hypothetical protein [Kocuria arenosa]|uniref:hypothetical protein n=1 Tax=Kocuria arenosa TaxID=3071446 RepID=UPI0034D55AC4
MTDRRSPTVIAVAGGSPTPLGRIAHLPGQPSGTRIVRIGHRRFQLLIPTTSYTPPRIITVAIKRHRVRFIDGLGPTTPDRVRAAAETAAQLLWEHYGRPAPADYEVAAAT